MEYCHQYDETIKHFGEGRLKDAGTIQKDLQLHDININSCYTDKYALWLEVELKYLSEWKGQLKELVADRISNLKGHFKSLKCKVLDQLDVKDTLHKLHANYVLVPADKAANNVIIVCKKYHIDTLVKELGIKNVNINNQTYIPIDDSFETIMKSHNQFITSVGLEISEGHQSCINHHINIGL